MKKYRKRILSYLLSSGKLKAYKIDKDKLKFVYSIIGIVFYVFLLVLLGLVYIKWQSTPTRKHYFQVEYLASADSLLNCRAQFTLFDPKIGDSKGGFIQSAKDRSNNKIRSNNENNETIKKRDKTAYNLYSEAVAFSSSFCHSKNNIVSKGGNFKYHVSKYMGHSLYNTISDSCKKWNTYIEKYSECMYYLHLDNEDLKKTRHENLSIAYNDFYDYLSIMGMNNDSLLDFDRENTLGIQIKTLGGELISRNGLKDSKAGYDNMTEALVFGSKERLVLGNTTGCGLSTSSKTQWCLSDLFKMEDITQSYYSIKFRSSTIPELLVRLDFVGTIDCKYTGIGETSWLNSNDDYQKYINVGRNFVEFRRESGNKDQEFLIFVKYNDMQKMQNSRLTILAMLISIALTMFLKSGWAVVNVGLIKRGIKNRGQKKLWLQKEEEYYKRLEEDDDDTPIVCD